MGGEWGEDVCIWVVVVVMVWMGVHRGIVGDDAWFALDVVALCSGDLV